MSIKHASYAIVIGYAKRRSLLSVKTGGIRFLTVKTVFRAGTIRSLPSIAVYECSHSSPVASLTGQWMVTVPSVVLI